MILFGPDIFAIEPNFGTWGIASRLCIFILISLLKLLGMLEVFSTDSYQLSKLGYYLVY